MHKALSAVSNVSGEDSLKRDELPIVLAKAIIRDVKHKVCAHFTKIIQYLIFISQSVAIFSIKLRHLLGMLEFSSNSSFFCEQLFVSKKMRVIDMA